MMTSETAQSRRSVVSAGLGLLAALLGVSVFSNALPAVHHWAAISSGYAACEVGLMIAGAAMMMGGLWTLRSLGRHKAALRVAAAGCVLSGVIIVAGVLTYVIPCSGPA